MSCRQTVVSLSFFRFMFNLEQFKGLIPDVRFVKLAVSLKINFYLIKTENRTGKSLTQLSYYCFLSKNANLLYKKMPASAKLKASWY